MRIKPLFNHDSYLIRFLCFFTAIMLVVCAFFAYFGILLLITGGSELAGVAFAFGTVAVIIAAALACK